MAIEDLFDHKCNIFHLQSESGKRGYGLPDSRNFRYSDVPDISDQPCHFSVRNGTLVVVQGEPQKDLNASLKLSLPIGTDIRINDKIVDCDTGFEYEAEVPRSIRGHHIVVQVHRASPKAI